MFDAIDGLAPASDRPTPSATIERRPRRELRSSPVPDNHHNTVTPGAVAATRDARAPHIFGTVAVRSGMPPREWVRRVTHGSQTFQRCLSRGTDCGAHTPSWRALVDEAAQTDGMERLSLVNRRVNSAIAYRRDAVATGLIDSWATPDYILSRQEGDCEDFALAKFWTLRAAGVPAEDMYVLVVRDRVARAAHAYLTVRQGSDFVLLDNRTNRVLSPNDVQGIVPVASISRNVSYMHGTPVPAENTVG